MYSGTLYFLLNSAVNLIVLKMVSSKFFLKRLKENMKSCHLENIQYFLNN